MPTFVTARVTDVLSERPGLQRVRLDDGSRAVALTELTGPVAAGDAVIVNTTAVELGLGTGGWHIVHWNLARREWHRDGGGHIMKLRYTSLQADVGAAEEHQPGAGWPDLEGRPVVLCSLHSQVGVVAAVLADTVTDARVAYVMTDGGALPLALSDLVADLRDRGLLDVTVTAGHAFGGDHEAVTFPSALDVATRIAGADVVVTGMGPGVVGTGSPLGTSALELAPAIDASAALGATPIVAARTSAADARVRHTGLSHHTTTALRLASRQAVVAHAEGTEAFAVPEPHRRETVAVPPVAEVLSRHGLDVRTMGRGPEDDPLFFATTAAAAVLAARLHRARGTVPG